MTDRLRTEVEAALWQASDDQIVRVMRFIDRLPVRARVEDLVVAIRPRLSFIRPARPLSVTRVLTLPFEDLLIDSGTRPASEWLVPRDFLPTIHAIALAGLPEALAGRLDRLGDGRLMDDAEAVLDLGAEIWPLAAERLGRVLTGDERPELGPVARLRLAGPTLILEHGEELVRFLAVLPPRPMPDLADEERNAALSLLMAARHASFDHFRCAYAILMRRSSDPGSIQELLAENAVDLSAAERALVLREAAVGCVNEIDALQSALAEGGAGRPVADTAEAAARLAALVESIERAPPVAALEGRQIRASRANACAAIARGFTAAVDGEMLRTFARIADARVPASDDEVAMAEAVARSTRRIELAGNRLGLGDQLGAILEREFRAYRDLLRRKLVALSALDDSSRRAAAIMDEVRLVEIVFGADAAIRLLADEGTGPDG